MEECFRKKKSKGIKMRNGLGGKNRTNKNIKLMEPGFSFKKNCLHIENNNYKNLIKKYGTPLICLSKNRLISNAKELLRVFKKEYKKTKIFYAYKANYFKPVLKELKDILGAEVISEFELKLALMAGVKPENIIFNGVGKTENELNLCVENNILINIDSFSEIEKIEKIAENKLKKACVGLRIHPALGKFEKNAFVKEASKLGSSIPEAEKLAKRISQKKHLKLKGIHAHVCSRQATPNMHLQVLDSMIKFCKQLTKHKIEVGFIDIGGGIDTRSTVEQKNSLEHFAKKISKKMKKTGLYLYLEPGRVIINDAAIVLSKIITKKVNNKKNWLITDIATNFLIPTKNANFKIIPAEITKRKRKKMNFGGGICSMADVIETNVFLPDVKEGEVIAVLNCGAYTSVMFEQFVYPRPTAVYLDRFKKQIIWEKGTTELMIKNHWGKT